MAFMNKINDLRGILTLVVLTLPSIAANIDCNGRPFHCLNSTHFMICVDLGSGVSSTIDDFVIPCPPTTVCQGTNRFECEFPTVTTVTSTPLEPSVSETIGVKTTPVYDVTTSIPFEEYYDTVSTTTLSGDVLLTQLEIVTESILSVTKDINVISVSESNFNLNETIPSVDVVQNDTTTLKPLSNNTANTEVTTDNEMPVLLSETIASVDVAQNNSTTLTTLHNTMSITVTEVNLDFTKDVNVPVTESNYTLNGTIASIDVLQNETTSLTPLSNNVETGVTEVAADLNEITVSEINSTLSETIVKVDVVENDTTTLTPFHNTMSITVTEVNLDFTKDVNVPVTESKYTSSGTIASIDVLQNETTSLTPLSNNVETGVTEVAADLNEITVSEMNSMLSETIDKVDVVENDTTTLTPLHNTMSITVTEGNQGFTKDVNVPVTESNYTSNGTIASEDVIQNETTSLTHLPNNIKTADTEVKTDFNEMPVSEVNYTLTETIANLDVVQNDTTTFRPLNNIMSTTVTEVNLGFTEDVNVPVAKSNYTLSGTIISGEVKENETTSLTPLPNHIVTSATEVTTEVSEITITEVSADFHKIVVSQTNFTLSGTIVSADGTQNDTTTLTPLFNNIDTTDTEVVPVYTADENANKTIASLDVVQNDTTIRINSNISITETTEINLTEIPGPESKLSLSETVLSVTNVEQNGLTPLYILSSTTEPYNLADIITKSIITEVSETTVSVPIYVVQDNQSTFNVPRKTNSTVLLNNTEAIITDMAENINLVGPGSNPTLIPSDNNEQTTPYTPGSASSPVELDSIVTGTVADVADDINVVNLESNISLDETKQSINVATNYPTTINALGINTIDLDIKVIDATESFPVTTTESVPHTTWSKTISNYGDNKAQEYLTKSFTPSSDNLPHSDIVTDSIVVDDAKNPKLDHSVFTSTPNAAVYTTQNDITTPSTFDAADFFSNPEIITIDVKRPTLQETTTLIITDANKINSVSANNLLLDTTVTEMYKSISAESYNNSATNLNTTEAMLTAEITTTIYQGSTTESIVRISKEKTPKNNDIIERTPNSILNTTVLPQAFESSTYGNIYYHTYTENIASDQGLTNHNNVKPIRSDKVLSTDSIDDTASTQVFVAMDDNLFISTPVLVTDTSVPSPVTTEPTIFVTHQKSNIQEVTTLGLETNDNIRLQLNNMKLFERVNISSSEVLTTSLESASTTESPNESVYLNAADQFMINASADKTTKQTLNDSILLITGNFPVESSTIFSRDITESVIPENIKEGIYTEQNTLATIYTVTGTSQVVFPSKPSHIAYALEESTTISLNSTPRILLNENTKNEINNTMTIIPNEAITRVTTLVTAADSSNRLEVSKPTSENYQSTKEVTDINVESIVIAGGNEIINHLLPTVHISETFTENTTENNLENVRPNAYNSVTTSTFNEDTTVNNKNYTVTVPGLYATTEMIAGGAIKSNEPALDMEIDKSKSDNISGVIQKTMSSLTVDNFQSDIVSVSDVITDIKARAPVLEGFDVDSVATESTNSVNTAQEKIPKSIAQGVVTSSPRNILTVHDFTTTEIDTNTPSSSIRDTESSLTATESLINYEEAIRQNNPLVNLLLNSVAIQTPNKEPAIPSTWNYIPATLTDVNEVSEKSSTDTPTQTEAFDRSMQQETYTESTTGSNIGIIPSHENLSTGIHHQNNDYGQPIDISTPAIKNPDVQTITPLATSPNDQGQFVTYNRGSSQLNQVFSQGKVELSILTEQVSPSKKIITKTQNSALPEKAKSIPTILSQGQHQESMANNGGINILQNQENIGFQLISTPSIKDLETKLHTQGISGNVQTEVSDKASMAGTENEGTMHNGMVTKGQMAQGAETNIFKSTSHVTEANIMQIQDTTIETQRSQGVSIGSPVKIPQTTSSASAKQYSDQMGTVTRAWRATMVTKPSIPITTPIIAKHPLIDVTSAEPNTKSWKHILPNSEITARPNLNTVISNSMTEFDVPHVTNPSIKIEQPSIGKTSSVPSSESWNEIPNTSIGITNGPIITSVSATPDEELINLQKKYVTGLTTEEHMETSPKTEFINVQSVGQKTDKVTTPILVSNLPDTDVVLMDSIKPVILILGEKADGITHSGISVIPKPPRKIVQSEPLEGSESVEKPESNEEKEEPEKPEDIRKRKETGENLEAVGNDKGEKFRVTPVMNPTVIQSDSGFENNKNASRFTISVKSDSTFEMITRKTEENTANGYLIGITNIEQLSSTERSAQYESIVPANTSQTKSSANTHTTAVPAFESSPTKSRNFVCKPYNRGRFSDNKDCRKFYICIGKSEPIEGTCPNNTVFSELRKQCTKNLSHCVRNNQFQCVSEGRFSDYLNDNIYYICVKNNVGTFIRFKLQCQSGYLLNKTSVRCVLNTEPSQSTSQQSTSDISKDSKQSVYSAKSEKLVQEPSKTNQFECEKEGKFVVANDCRKYYICKKIGKSKYRQKIKKCDSDELFHKDKKKCVDADSYECS